MTVPTSDWKNLLGSKNCIPTLLCLRENGPLKKTDIYSMISKSDRMADKIENMARLGIVRMDDSGKSTIVELTDTGRRVADLLAIIGDLMDETSSTLQDNHNSEESK